MTKGFSRRQFIGAGLSLAAGGVCEQLPGKTYAWDEATSTFDNPAATELLKSRYRKGWELEGL